MLDRQERQVAPLLGWIGRLGGPVLALVVYLILPGEADGLTEAGRATAAIAVLMAVLWMTEAMPLPATALLPVAFFPLAGLMSIAEATAPYANDIIFLFMGGFMVALSIERWGLHRRLALHVLLVVGTQPTRLIGGVMVATAFISMWINSSATTVMMLPLGTSIIALVLRHIPGTDEHEPSAFAVSLLLGMAYAASIGSFATPIATPPNLLLRGYLSDNFGIEIGFGKWMLVGVPLSLSMLAIAWFLLTRLLYPPEMDDIPGGRALVREELDKLGPVSRGEWTVLGVFVATALAWILRDPVTSWTFLTDLIPPVARVTDSGIAVMAALLLFAIPIDPKRGVFALDWDNALRLPWGVLILFGGGLSLAGAIQTSGLAAWIGTKINGLSALPTIALVFAIVFITQWATELTSNTATAALFLPIAGSIAVGVGIDPLLVTLPTALAATCCFTMPVATPPNAIVFGTGHITILQMVRAGVVLSLVASVMILIATYTLGVWVLGINV